MEKFIRKISILFLGILATFLVGCVYFNTVYNARTVYDKGYKSYKEDLRQSDHLSATTRTAFLRAADKGKKILTQYSDSKYVDDAYLIIGKSYYYLGQYNQARRYLSDLLNNYPQSPYNLDARLYLGMSQQELDEPALARHEFEYLIENADDPMLTAQAYLSLSDIDKADGNTEKMIREVEIAIKIAPDDELKADAAWRTAKWARKNENFDRAREFYNLAKEYTSNPQFDRKIQLEIAQVHREEGEEEQAIASVQKMLQKQDFTDLWPDLEFELGRIYETTGDTSKAADQYRYVLDEYKNTSAAATASYFLGLQAFKRRDYDGARTQFTAVSSINRNSEYADEARKYINILNNFDRIKLSRRDAEESLVNFYKKQTALDSSAQQTNADTSRGFLQGLMSKGKEKKVTFSEIYPWLAKQDSVPQLQKYIELLYRMQEYYYFELRQPASAQALTDTIITLANSNETTARVLALRAHALRNVMESLTQADQLEQRIIQQYPETTIARYLKFKEENFHPQKISQDEQIAKDRYRTIDSLIIAEKYHSAIQKMKLLHITFPDTPYGAKALYGIGWVYDHHLRNLDSALVRYEQFQDEYPDNNLNNRVTKRISELENIQTAIAQQSAEKTTSSPSAGEAVGETGSEYRAAPPDTVLLEQNLPASRPNESRSQVPR